ncbi:hypothetical protein SEA_EYRE_3 [Gordonia phage Eyre]|uniref:Uncharacterized protein n=1 Tax=Gordonia phage Eyre TaxID=1887646 RepID=A0A1B3AZU8_9CAUD|nr:hypothetical protein BIZ73_gp03 [Gordonia phage Eyre]AOE44283.1 hypothetical protein SEA_EYRE_3 [Gordonia phage Eyre]
MTRTSVTFAALGATAITSGVAVLWGLGVTLLCVGCLALVGAVLSYDTDGSGE